jgi:myo-inositol-1(or 4)-monophosphatase
MTLDIHAARDTAVAAARAAGERLLEFFESPTLQRAFKSNTIDIVTEADKAAEAIIAGMLLTAYPDHHLIGEEGGGQGAPIESAAYRWYVDPLDGTTNFSHGLPLFSVSIALTDRHNRPLVAVVLGPYVRELFVAAAGEGATLNGRPIHVSTADTLHASVLTTGFPYTKATDADNNLAQWNALVPLVQGERRLGSAALDLAYVAAGRLEGFWEMRINPWDILAGMLLVREAGGLVTDYTGDDSDAITRPQSHIVATNGRIHAELLRVLRETGAPQARA